MTKRAYFMRERRGRNFFLEGDIMPGDEIISEIPLSVYKTGINDIGKCASDSKVRFFITFSQNIFDSSALWTRINNNVNRALTGIRIVNAGDSVQRYSVRITYN